MCRALFKKLSPNTSETISNYLIPPMLLTRPSCHIIERSKNPAEAGFVGN